MTFSFLPDINIYRCGTALPEISKVAARLRWFVSVFVLFCCYKVLCVLTGRLSLTSSPSTTVFCLKWAKKFCREGAVTRTDIVLDKLEICFFISGPTALGACICEASPPNSLWMQHFTEVHLEGRSSLNG